LNSRSSRRSSGSGSTCFATKSTPSSVRISRTAEEYGHHSAWYSVSNACRLRLAPAAEHEAAEREAETERPECEAADRERLPPGGQALPAPERLLLVGRQRLAAALLPQRTTGAQTEIQVVEDLRGVIGHCVHSIYSLIRSCRVASSMYPISTRVHARIPRSREPSRP